MNRIMLYQENACGMTGVSNVFIDTFMKDANDAQLKIYLYLIRMFSSNMPVSISDMADKFNHTEREVIRSLQYWERMNLLLLDYDENKNITGIRLQTPGTNEPVAPTVKPLAPIVPMVPASPAGEPKNSGSQAARIAPEKPSYSADLLRTYKDKEEIGEMLCIVEQYLGKTLSPADLKSILYIHLELGYSMDMLDALLEYCLERGKKEMRYIEKTAMGWYEQGIDTVKQAKAGVSKYDKTIYSVMKALGKNGIPTAKEVDYINKWTGSFGFSMDIIFECCERTVLAVDSHRFEYADKILTAWKEHNAYSLRDIKELDKAFRNKPKNSGSGSNSGGKTPQGKFNQFPQHDYDFAALEKEILSN